ncbi:MAG: hypothetical protein DRN35_05410 [Thermoplasmata archaeon]|nr:MAG: hypothetical protein DRN28_03720 [Thermoplasmata archaeon]RLF69798.1 MAG: hypothetical protein DRN35_05410 [Thermoplasmata archaeon]RLF70591.1 MAG: hypothetical protein DRN40_04195 [Thermoplasmata archaeon]RLF70764.1 MAG: hypothetical protein DRN55_08190 [Thermoplasmata archaeon]HDD60540.1 zinc-ribbon domain-containing protein [Euryarchaeota archaeon]
MPICSNCGISVPEGRTTCPNCGTAVGTPSYSALEEGSVGTTSSPREEGIASSGGKKWLKIGVAAIILIILLVRVYFFVEDLRTPDLVIKEASGIVDSSGARFTVTVANEGPSLAKGDKITIRVYYTEKDYARVKWTGGDLDTGDQATMRFSLQSPTDDEIPNEIAVCYDGKVVDKKMLIFSGMGIGG